MLALAAFYLALAKIALSFATIQGNVTILWPASGLALAALLVFGSRYWPGVFLGAFAAGVTVDDPLWLAFAIAAGNTLEPLAGTWMLRRLRTDINIPLLRDYYKMIVPGALVAPLPSAVIGSGCLLLAGFVPTGQLGEVMLHWWMADALGIVIIAPALLVWRRFPDNLHSLEHLWEGMALLGLAWYLGAIPHLGATAPVPLHPVVQLFLLIPLYLWAALRFGRHGLMLLMMLFFFQSLTGLLMSVGMFAADVDGLRNFWLYYMITGFSAMTLSTVLLERQTNARLVADERARLKSIIDTMPDAVYCKHPDNSYALRNRACLACLDTSEAEAAGKSDFDFFPEDEASRRMQKDAALMAEGRSERSEEWVVFKDGHRKLLDSSRAPLRNHAGDVIGLVAVCRDITEQRALQHEHELLYRAISASLNEVYIFDADTLRFRYVNQGALSNLGYSAAEISNLTPVDLKPYFTAEDFRGLLTPLFMHQEPVKVFETMHRRKDGSLYPVEVHLQLFENAGQRSFLAVIQDISRKLESEQQLRLAASVFDYSKQAIVITDTNASILSVNPSFTTVTGYTEDEVIGRNPRLLGSGRHDKAFYQSMWADLLADGHWSGEIWNRRKDGSLYIEWLDIVSVQNHLGQPVNYIGLSYDITERKAVEESMRQMAEHDFLTGLPNRILLLDRIAQALAAAQRNHGAFAVFYLDLNRFKEMNDTLGHQFGDEVLKVVANRLTELVRASDTVCRMGGDEFVILVPEIVHPDQALALQEKLLEAFQEPCDINGMRMVISFSIGHATYPQHGNSVDQLLESADRAMYAAKTVQRQA